MAIFAAALLAYQASRVAGGGDARVAVAHSWDILRLERALGLDIEAAAQSWTLGHEWLVQALNGVYLFAHLPVTAAFFVWVYQRGPGVYRTARNGFLAANAIALAVFVGYPVAPPRILEGTGLIDTLRASSGVDLHGGELSGWFNQYAAVPSMHFGYALVVGLGVGILARHRWVRLAGLVYPALVLLAITATANHLVLDAAAGALVVAVGFGLCAIIVRRGAHRRRRIANDTAQGVEAPAGLPIMRGRGRCVRPISTGSADPPYPPRAPCSS